MTPLACAVRMKRSDFYATIDGELSAVDVFRTRDHTFVVGFRVMVSPLRLVPADGVTNYGLEMSDKGWTNACLVASQLAAEKFAHPVPVRLR